MSILEIIKTPNKILRVKSKKIKRVNEEIINIAKDLSETILDHQSESESGVAMAAIQAGIPIRLIVIREEDGNFLCFINAEVLNSFGEEKEDLEGCLSVPGIYGMVKRPEGIKIKAIDLNNKIIQLKVEGFLSRALQHEIDHTNGILFTDHIKDLNKLYKLQKDGKLITKEGNILDEGTKEI